MQSIVVGTDGSPNAEAAVRKAADIAKGTGALVHLVCAYPDAPNYGANIASSAKRDPVDLRSVAESVVARAEREVEALGVAVMTHVREGSAAHVILDVAQEESADLVVVGARGLTGLRRFLLGSVSSKLAHHTTCSLMIVRDE